jgi:hypothetical protein
VGIEDMVNKAKDMAEGAVEKAKDIAAEAKEDAMQVKDIAQGEGSLADKAKASIDAVKD